MKNILLICFLSGLFSIQISKAQHSNTDHVMIHVFGAYENDTTTLTGANAFWLGTTEGGAADDKGIVHLPFYHHLPHSIVVTYVGLQNDTILVANKDRKHYYVFLPDDALLKTIEISAKKQASFISTINPIRADILGEDELRKAACCDLSESFETNAAVDVSYSDAVTGAKEIKLLGLDGTYVEMVQENVPSLRGLAIPFGLAYVPGPWLSTISISKGAGSILSGHESITGSINYCFKQPFDTNPFELDLFGNHMGRYEVNVLTGFDVNEKVGSVLAANVGGIHSKHDRNSDGFLDHPLYNRFNVMNRWKFIGDNVRGQFFVNYLLDDRTGGQNSFEDADRGTTNAYGFGMKTNRVSAFGKTAFFFKEKVNQSVGTTYSVNYHNQEGFFGLNDYKGEQFSFNGTILFKTIINNTNHGIVVGGNAHVDHYDETFDSIRLNDKYWNTGAFVEYTYSHLDKFKLVGGARLDYHSAYQLQFSPRIHAKWSPKEKTTFRLSAGRGFRDARVLGENISLMASSRDFIIEELPGIEAAWNTGISLVQKFNIKERQGHIALDFYHTNFQKQVIYDVNEMDNTLRIYNLNGKSYANSFLAEVAYEIAKGLEFKFAYKLDDVKTTFKNGLETKPFTYLHKGLVVANYKSKNKEWQLDLNLDMHGRHKLPSSFSGDQPEEFSPFYVSLGAQVSKFFSNGIEIYVGGENITNYRQPNPIIGADDPFGDRFDTSQVWGPVSGGIFYGGFRYSLKKKGES